jgi:hypothetical protein
METQRRRVGVLGIIKRRPPASTNTARQPRIAVANGWGWRRQGALSSDELPELGAKSGARRKRKKRQR